MHKYLVDLCGGHQSAALLMSVGCQLAVSWLAGTAGCWPPGMKVLSVREAGRASVLAKSSSSDSDSATTSLKDSDRLSR